jgi:hypothetical protein
MSKCYLLYEQIEFGHINIYKNSFRQIGSDFFTANLALCENEM